MSRTSKISCLLAAALVAGLGLSPAVAADYPPKPPDAPVFTIPPDFKPSAPEDKFATTFNFTKVIIKVDQPVKPKVDGFAKNKVVTETIKLPNGLFEHLPPLKTDKFGNVQLPPFFFKVKGTYVMSVKVGNKTKKITFVVK
jgi:hypothetical protein